MTGVSRKRRDRARHRVSLLGQLAERRAHEHAQPLIRSPYRHIAILAAALASVVGRRATLPATHAR